MGIGILGTGIVGQTLAEALDTGGHEVVVGTRDPAATLAKTEPDMYGRPAFRVWQEAHPDVGLGAFSEAAAHGEFLTTRRMAPRRSTPCALPARRTWPGSDARHGDPARLLE